ncbi:MAG: response regulator [Kofleriaceae bacterium]|nr:response regulator [Kofleriaceae bacterium]
MRILVVDDYPGAAEISCTLLQLMGHEGFAATSGQDALARAGEVELDVVILDLSLPDINGYDVARQLRARAGRRIFIAAMTGWNTTEDRARSRAAGIDMHVAKPTSADKLSQVIQAAKKLDDSGAADRA